jgi:hypothetical protein
MRLSCLVTFLLLFTFPLLAQHSSGASSSGGGSHSSGASSGGSVSSSSGHASFGSSGVSHASTASHSHSTTSAAKNNLTTTTSQPTAEKHHFFSLPWHKKSSPELVTWRPTPCLGHNCTPCRAGSRNGVGMCAPQYASCFAGQSWAGSYCAPLQNWWLNDCSGIARQLEAQRRHMQGLNDPGQSLIYQQLRNQYQSCLSRRGLQTGFYALNDTRLFNLP